MSFNPDPNKPVQELIFPCKIKKDISEEGLRPSTLLKNKLWHRCFPVNFAKFSRAPFF